MSRYSEEHWRLREAIIDAIEKPNGTGAIDAINAFEAYDDFLAAPAPDTLDVDIKTLRTALAATHSALHSGEGCYEAGEMHELISTTLFRLRGLDTEAGEQR